MYSASAAASAMTVPQSIPEAHTAHAAHAAQPQHLAGVEALASLSLGPHQQENEQAGRAEELAHLSQRDILASLGASVVLEARDEHAPNHVTTHEHTHEHEAGNSHAWIGVALVFGFILMYLIDTLQAPSSPRGQHIPLTQLDEPDAIEIELAPQKSRSKSTTIGLVIHACADGIALGASSASSETQRSLGIIVFIAILVHKAPAAFGLTSVLLKQGPGKRAARGHLLVFSLAAPLGALITWTLVNLLGSSDMSTPAGTAQATWWTGVVLIFSGGTFL